MTCKWKATRVKCTVRRHVTCGRCIFGGFLSLLGPSSRQSRQCADLLSKGKCSWPSVHIFDALQVVSCRFSQRAARGKQILVVGHPRIPVDIPVS